MLSIENKMNTIMAMEYKLDNHAKVLNNIQNTLDTFHMKNNQILHDGLFNEFTARGVLSSIKLVEKKTDRLLMMMQNKYFKISDNENDKPKLQIKCTTPKFIEDILNDISSKVDLIFDGFNDNKIFIDNTEDEDYLEISEGSGETAIKQKNIHSSKRDRKNMQSCKKTNQALDEILTRNIRAENILLQILNKEHMLLDIMNREINIRKNEQNKGHCSEDLIENVNIILNSYFDEQRVNFENILNKVLIRRCNNIDIPTTTLLQIPTTTTDPITTVQTTLPTVTSSVITETFHDYKINKNPTWKPVLDEEKSSCEDLSFEDTSGVYIFAQPLGAEDKMFFNKRYCEIRNDGLWTVIQRRDNYAVQHNFNASWEDYKIGFGDLHNDFWMGNAFLYQLSKDLPLILRVELSDFENNTAWAEYNVFKVTDEESKYTLIVGGYTGNATDSFSSHNGSAFSTFDKSNDQAPECCPCSLSYGGGWWFNKCFESNLNGIYYQKPHHNGYFKGLIWEHWLGNYSLKKAIMMVKSKGSVIYNNTVDDNLDQRGFNLTNMTPYFEEP